MKFLLRRIPFAYMPLAMALYAIAVWLFADAAYLAFYPVVGEQASWSFAALVIAGGVLSGCWIGVDHADYR